MDKIFKAKAENPTAKISNLEKEIDELVYGLYDLSEEEKKIIKGGN